jgi:hypothetical protein
MKYNFAMLLLITVFLMEIHSLYADEKSETEEIRFHTIYRDDHVYETRGAVELSGCMDDLNTVLLNFHDYRSWILRDLTRNSVQSDKLPAFLVDVRSDPQIAENFKVIYDLNRFLKFKGLKAPFTAKWKSGITGDLESISFIYTGKKSYLREGSYSFYFEESGDDIRISFISKVRLSGLLNLFFTVEAYDRNMGYYIRGLSENLIKRLELEAQSHARISE